MSAGKFLYPYTRGLLSINKVCYSHTRGLLATYKMPASLFSVPATTILETL